MKAVRAHAEAAFRWSREAEVTGAEILAAGLGMAAPLALAAALGGDLRAGLAAAAGALLATGGAMDGAGPRQEIPALAKALAPSLLALVAASLLAGHGWRSDVAVAVLAVAAAQVGGTSRAGIIATTRFITALIIAAALMGEVPDRAGFLIVMSAGALWTAALRLAFGFLAGRRRRALAADASPEPSVAVAAKEPVARRRRSLATFRGWNFALRLGLCLGLAAWLRWLWPGHHLYWIALTVALLLPRRAEAFPVKTTQRALGTALGLIGAAAFLEHPPPVSILILGIGLLAAARPLLRSRNYLAYSAIMTPLLVLILDAGSAPGAGILTDRLVATLIGAALVVTANLAMRLLFPAQAPPKPLSSPPRRGAG